MISNIGVDDKYTVLSVVKEGPFGRVEKVRDAGGVVRIRKYFTADQEVDNEYTLLATLSHPSLPTTIEYYELSGQNVLIEKYVEGIKLSDCIEDLGKPPPKAALDHAIQLCTVVEYLHHWPVPIIHRDIKPGNIICTMDGSIKLVDFGAARTYKAGNSKDTLHIGMPGYAWNEDNSLDVDGLVSYHVHNIRHRLAAYSCESYIDTVWGVGFRLNDV